VGAGACGTAMATVAARCNNEILLWVHDPGLAETIAKTHTNPLYLPQVTIPENVRPTNSLDEAAAFSDTLFMVVPSHVYRSVLEQLKPRLDGAVKILSGTKGIEIDTQRRMSEVTEEVLRDELAAFGVLSGPTFALEVARGDPTAAVVASRDVNFAQVMQQALSCTTFRLYHTTDVVGVEIAGSLKNVIAIAAGVLEGLGLGFNTNAALITRG